MALRSPEGRAVGSPSALLWAFLPVVTLGADGCTNPADLAAGHVAQYQLTQTSPAPAPAGARVDAAAEAPYSLVAEYVFLSADVMTGNPDCVAVVYFQLPQGPESNLAFDFLRNASSSTTCTSLFHAILNGAHGAAQYQFTLEGEWSVGSAAQGDFHAEGTYAARVPPSLSIVEGGTFVVDIDIDPASP